jgi:FAD:protein FMN transferase
MQSIELRAMGSRVFAVIDRDGNEALRALRDVSGLFEAREARASRFRPESELCRLNARSGESIRVSQGLWNEVAAALSAARWSGGLVTPTVLAAVERAGYDRSFERIDGAASETRAFGRPSPSYRRITLDRERSEILLPPGVRLDLGGTAKGRAADHVSRRLGRVAPALVDAGGDVSVSGPKRDGSPWPVAISNPARPEEALEVVALSRGGIATSGRDFRRWRHAGVERHHIVDPRSGEPARSDVLTATVIANSALHAEIAAKVLIIAGSRAGLAWLEAESGLAAFLVLESGHSLESARFAAYRWRD